MSRRAEKEYSTYTGSGWVVQSTRRFDEWNVVLVMDGDPAITVDLREDPAAGTCVVTATLPAGYGPTTREKAVEILARTDLPKEPLIRIPVHILPAQRPDRQIWVRQAMMLIGKPLPAVTPGFRSLTAAVRIFSDFSRTLRGFVSPSAVGCRCSGTRWACGRPGSGWVQARRA
ncbi:MAG TPA: hypothetical protein VLM89_08555 [Phycisphaerae bacterium]|nr:hypothetical protein [Phycisphaerae bacterium]